MAYIGVSPSNGVRRVHTYTATASQTTFSGAGAEGTSLSYKDSNFVDVYQNGIKLGDADYTSTSGTSIVLAQGASVDDLVVVVVFDVFSVSDTVSKADGGTFDGNVTMGGTFTSQGIDDNASSNVITVSTGGFTLSPATSNLYQTNGALSYYGTTNNVYLIGAGSGGGLLLGGDSTRAENINISASSNDIQFTTGSALAMKIDSTGAITKPLQPAFLATNTDGSQAFAVGSIVDVNFSVEIFDQNNDFASSTFTAPIDGRYQFNVNCRLDDMDSASTYYLVRLVTSNRNYTHIWDSNEFSSDTDYFTLQVSCLADMDASDTAKVVVYQNSGTAQTKVIDASYFSGHLVC